MGKRRFTGRVLSCFLVSVLLVTSLSGCGKKKSGVSLEDAKKIDKNCIFKQEELEGILESGEEVSVIDHVGDKIRMIAQTEKGKSRYITFNPDGSDVQAVNLGGEKGFYVYDCAFDKDGNAYMQCYEGDRDSMYVTDDSDDTADAASSDASSSDAATADASKSDAATADASTSEVSTTDVSAEESKSSEDAGSEDGAADEGKSYFVKLDPTGKELAKVDLAQFEPKEGENEEDGFYIYGLAWTEKYGIVCLTPGGIQTFDENKGPSMLFEKKAIGDEVWLNGMAKISDTQMLLTYYDDSGDGGEIHAIVDLDSKKLGQKLEGFGKYEQYDFFSGDGVNLYASNDNGIYKYDLKTSKLVKLLDFKDSNIGTGAYMWFKTTAVSETEFIACLPVDSGFNSTNYEFVRLTKVNPEDVPDKTIITLSSQWLDQTVGSEIMKFNRSSDKYMIKIIDYSVLYPDDWEEARKQFNLDITSGKAADIINVTGNEAALKKYVDKGILLDLTPAFEKGGPLGDIEFIPNIAEMMKVDGKFYTFMPSFDVETCSVKTKFLNGKTTLTYKDWDDIIKSQGATYDLAFGTYNTKESLAQYMWTYYGDKFVDWQNKKCNFNDPEFIEFLNFVNKFPMEEVDNEDEEGNYISDDEYVQQDKILFYRTWLSSPYRYAEYKQGVFKEDFEFVGFPNNAGDHLASISGTSFAINSKTEHKDVIYDLIKNILLAENDDSMYGGFSPVKSKFDASFEATTKERSDDDYSAYYWDQAKQKEVKLKPMTQEEAQKLKDYVLAIKTLDCSDEEVSKIVQEETGAFFSGQKSAEQVAEVIQNRVTTYLNENS